MKKLNIWRYKRAQVGRNPGRKRKLMKLNPVPKRLNPVEYLNENLIIDKINVLRIRSWESTFRFANSGLIVRTIALSSNNSII